jgi:hypothetical protein
MEILLTLIIQDLMETVVNRMKMDSVWAEDGRMPCTPTTDTSKNLTTLTSVATTMMVTEISISDHNSMDTTRTPAEKLVKIFPSLLCRIMVGAHVTIPMDLPLEPTTSVTTTIVETVKEFHSVAVGQMQCILTTSTSKGILRLLMTSNITWSKESLTNNLLRATTCSTEPSQ